MFFLNMLFIFTSALTQRDRRGRAWSSRGRRSAADDERHPHGSVNEIVEDNQSAARQRYYIHGVSYVDERLMMYADSTSRPYYYTWDRMYNVYAIVDRAGAIVEHAVLGLPAACDGYGRPYLRESCGRGDMNNDTVMTSTDTARFDLARAASIFEPRADMDAEGDQGGSLKGDVDSTDQTLFDNKKATWDPLETPPAVGQPFSDVGNPYQFQGVPHFALNSGAFGLAAKLVLNHHRARFADPVTGRWDTRDPIVYVETYYTLGELGSIGRNAQFRVSGRPFVHLEKARLFLFLECNANSKRDPSGLSVNVDYTCKFTGVTPPETCCKKTCLYRCHKIRCTESPGGDPEVDCQHQGIPPEISESQTATNWLCINCPPTNCVNCNKSDYQTTKLYGLDTLPDSNCDRSDCRADCNVTFDVAKKACNKLPRDAKETCLAAAEAARSVCEAWCNAWCSNE